MVKASNTMPENGNIAVTLPDGSRKGYCTGVTILQVAESIGSGLARAALAGKVNGRAVDLSCALDDSVELEILTFSSDAGKEVYWHSTAHIMAQAVQDLFPDVKVTLGPPIENGFYYDFDREKPFTPDELHRIEVRMRELIAEAQPFERQEITREAAIDLFRERGESYKLEILEEIEPGETISIYKNADKWLDLCRGPHVPDTGRIKAVKLLSSSGAYWRGDENNVMLQRIYGISFPGQKDLNAYLEYLEEARNRDHRTLGGRLDLFSINDTAGPGLVLWHPKGARIRNQIEDFWREAHYGGGYDLVCSPHIGRSRLWETSGHLDFFHESMYPPMDIDGQAYFAKPMNCPFHSLIYKSRRRSYRELPFRWAELGTVYRYEMVGTLHGLLRVRGFTQDDAHIFCRPDQVEDEVARVIDFTLFILKSFGFEDFNVYISTRPGKAVGDPADWERATDALRRAVDRQKLPYRIDAGAGAFYGPKIDVTINDALNREWQCTTIQFDFNLSERFGLTYIGEDGREHQPYMVHRTLLGSMERFMGVLIEHYGGAFPTWLAPVQAEVIPIAERHNDYGAQVAAQLEAAGVRVHVDTRNERMNAKIRDAQVQKVPFMLVVGDREADAGAAAVRLRSGENLGAMPVADVAARIVEETEAKT
jgi:threonyl-tRNA synthetase